MPRPSKTNAFDVIIADFKGRQVPSPRNTAICSNPARDSGLSVPVVPTAASCERRAHRGGSRSVGPGQLPRASYGLDFPHFHRQHRRQESGAFSFSDGTAANTNRTPRPREPAAPRERSRSIRGVLSPAPPSGKLSALRGLPRPSPAGGSRHPRTLSPRPRGRPAAPPAGKPGQPRAAFAPSAGSFSPGPAGSLSPAPSAGGFSAPPRQRGFPPRPQGAFPVRARASAPRKAFRPAGGLP